MKKSNFNKKNVKRTITWAMALVMSLSTVMSSTVVYANGNEINNYVDELELWEEYVDSDSAEYHNDEAAAVANNSESVKAMNEQVEKAQQAVVEAEAAVVEAEQAAAKAEQAVEDAAQAKTDAEQAATDATNAANAADTKVDALEEKETAAGVDAYNNQVAEDQNAIDNSEAAADAVEKAADAADTAAIEADKAADAADAAKAALEKALAVETDEVNEEVLAAVEEANQAAADAKAAAEAADAAKTEAEDEVAKAIAEYNLYAMNYNLPLYGETEVTYTTEVAKTTVEAAGMTYQAGEKAELEAEIEAIEDATLEEEKAKVDAAVEALDDAEEALAAAETAAEEAIAAAAEATAAVEGAAEAADAAAEAVNNYYVTPAQDAVDATKAAIEDKTNEISGLNTALESAKATAKTNGEASYNNTLASKKTAMERAKAEYEACPDWRVITKAILKGDFEDARDAYNNYNTQTKKDEVVNNFINNDAAVKAATADVNKANNDLVELNKKFTVEDGVLAAETATRDAYIAEATHNAEEEAREALVAEIEAILADYSAEINQIDYDEDLNEWANEIFNGALIDDNKVIYYMDNKYDEDAFDKIINIIGLTQWIIDTDDVNEVMDELRAAYKESIENYYEELATVEANWAAMDTEAAKAAVATEVAKMDTVSTTISEAKTAVETAADNLETAQNTYDDAATRLEGLKNSVAGKTFDSVTLAALQEKIAAAQKAVDVAAEELKDAQASKASAEKYAAWANELVKEHYTRAYSQAIEDENGVKVPVSGNLKDYDTTNENVTSRPSADFVCVSPGTQSVVVPYTIYRDYVEAMYGKYKLGQNGKGTSTGSNMDVIFWEVDEDGVLTGKTFATIDELSSGTYFVGYTFKKESDGYHIDGVMYEYTKPVVPTIPSDDDDDDTVPSTPAVTPAVVVEEDVIVIEDEEVPLAQVVVVTEEEEEEEEEIVVIEEEDVPLASVEEDDEEVIVEIEEEDVPLAVVVDDNCIIHWLMVILMVAYAAYEVVSALTRKGKKVKKSEYVLTGVYVAVIALLMILGKCEADAFVAVGGAVVGIAGVVSKMIQAKKANSQMVDAE